MSPGSLNKVIATSAICAVLHITQQGQARWFGLTGSSKCRRNTFQKPLTMPWEEKTPSLLPVLRQEFPNSANETLDGTFSGADRSRPPGQVPYFHWGGCEIPLLEGSRVPRCKRRRPMLSSHSYFTICYLTLLARRGGPLSTYSQKGSCPRREFSQNQVPENLSSEILTHLKPAGMYWLIS